MTTRKTRKTLEEIMQSNITKVGPRGAVKRGRGRPKGSKNKRPREEVLAEQAAHPWSEYLGAKQVGMRYGIYPGTARTWAEKGLLPPPYLVAPNTVRWKRSELDEWDKKYKQVKYARRNKAAES